MTRQVLCFAILLVSAGCATSRRPDVSNMLFLPLSDIGDDTSAHLVCISSHLNIRWGVLSAGHMDLYEGGPKTLNGLVTHIIPSPSGKFVAIASWGGEGATPGLDFFGSDSLLDWIWNQEKGKWWEEHVDPVASLEAYPADLTPGKWIDDRHFVFSCNMDFNQTDRTKRIIQFDQPGPRPMRQWEVDVERECIKEISNKRIDGD